MKKVTFIAAGVACIIAGGDAKCFCSCWDSGVGAAETPDPASRGSHCGGGIDWDSGFLSHMTCKKICNEKFPGYPWAYVDQPAMNKCKNQNPTKVIFPSEEQKNIINLIGSCEAAAGTEIAIQILMGGVIGTLGELAKKGAKDPCARLRALTEGK